MGKRIAATAWRVGVSGDGNVFSLAVRTEAGREYEVFLGTVDSTPLLSDLLADMAQIHQGLPPRSFAAGAGPRHPKSQPLRPLSTAVQHHDGAPVLVLDFGGTVLKIAIDPAGLQQALAGLSELSGHKAAHE